MTAMEILKREWTTTGSEQKAIEWRYWKITKTILKREKITVIEMLTGLKLEVKRENNDSSQNSESETVLNKFKR